jgi:formylglycine-generating enzyme required for sulfatase activity
MKYETSQDQWIGFFNLLTIQQKQNRDVTGNSGKRSDSVRFRNGLSWVFNINDATTSFPQVPISYLTEEDIAAYLDWACLRWMSDFEFTKACRGPLTAKENEFAWGSTTLHDVRYSLLNNGSDAEVITATGVHIGNSNYNRTSDGLSPGPFRCGIFAASATHPNREETGSTYYGVMEMSGNVYESVIDANSQIGRFYSGVHGDGSIGANGDSNQSTWPDARGIIMRGGSYGSSSYLMHIASRGSDGQFVHPSEIGFRGVRTAP